MPEYLLAAEADKIQDLLFRSARLSEVIGGSQQLTSFCRQVVRKILGKLMGDRFKKENLIVSDGGILRIVFESKEEAEEMGRLLADCYGRITGGTISVAEPVCIGDSFKDSNSEANKNLRKIKKSGGPPVSTEHFPYMAVCASCGISPAIAFQKKHKDDKENYVCGHCLLKDEAREAEFLEAFRKNVEELLERDLKGYEFPFTAEDVAVLDSKNYVAYLLADGNDMGIWFDLCETKENLAQFSKKLGEVMRKSLAGPCKPLMDRTKQLKENLLPVLPLILGGDDLFALLPSKWSVHFALMFCEKYEEEMNKTIEQIGLSAGAAKPTMSCAVVICKGKYPYTLAYQFGEKLLRESKKLSKEQAFGDIYHSTINIGVISGNDVVSTTRAGDYPSFLPYPNRPGDNLKRPGLVDIINERFNLRHIPAVRRSQLEGLYGREDINERFWHIELRKTMTRIATLDLKTGDCLNEAIKNLGNEGEFPYLRRDKNDYRHGLPDLLMAWDYLFDLNKDDSLYREEV